METETIKPDKKNCQYWWDLYYRDGSVKQGYSMFDRENPNETFIEKIKMFCKNGYVLKCKRIVVYRTINAYPDRLADVIFCEINDEVITLHYQEEWLNNQLEWTFSVYFAWLKRKFGVMKKTFPEDTWQMPEHITRYPEPDYSNSGRTI